ncbi:MAG: hypothetical protein PHO63_06135 [Bacilli bacterium]|nr:hypothetical protein [Bacilli bacterium]
MIGGGGYSTNYTRDLPSKEDYCDSLKLIVDLQQLQPSLKDYKINDILEVKFNEDLINVTGEHGLCGYIPAAQQAQISKCLNKGKSFIAKIISITDISCRVSITPLNN